VQVEESWEATQSALTHACLHCIKQREGSVTSLWKQEAEAKQEMNRLDEERERLTREKEDTLNRHHAESKREVERVRQDLERAHEILAEARRAVVEAEDKADRRVQQSHDELVHAKRVHREECDLQMSQAVEKVAAMHVDSLNTLADTHKAPPTHSACRPAFLTLRVPRRRKSSC